MVAKDTAPSGSSRPAVRPKAPAAPGGRSGAGRAKGSTPAVGDRLSRRANAPSIGSFFQDSRSELRKVTWPTRQETINLTGAVIAMTVGLAVFLGIVDELATLIVQPILGK